MNKPQRRGLAMSIPGGLVLGVAVALALTLVSALGLAKLVETGILDQKNIGYAIMSVLACISFSTSMLAAEKIKHQRVIICVASGFLYWSSLLCMAAVFFGGEYGAIGETWLIIMAGSVTAAIFYRKLQPKTKYSKSIRKKI